MLTYLLSQQICLVPGKRADSQLQYSLASHSAKLLFFKVLPYIKSWTQSARFLTPTVPRNGRPARPQNFRNAIHLHKIKD